MLDDLGAESDEALHNRAMSALGRLSMYCFRNARSPVELIRGLAAFADLVREVRAAPNGITALITLWRYILLVDDREPEIILQQLAAATNAGRQEEDIMTAGEVLIQRGEQKGRLQGQRQTLGKQLAFRFGALPEWATARLEVADSAALDAWTERVLTAPSLEEALAG